MEKEEKQNRKTSQKGDTCCCWPLTLGRRRGTKGRKTGRGRSSNLSK